MKVDGACHCGAIRYEAEVDPEAVFLCHCTDCQTLSGAAFRTVVATLPGTFKLLSGEPTKYVKRGESGNEREQTFCGTCGSPINSAAPGPHPKVVGLRVGTITKRHELRPKDQFWFRSAQPWVEEIAAIPRTATQPVFDPKGGFKR